MTTTEHLLTTAAEECAEVAQAISKALRFGLDDAHPKNGNLGNRELIAREFEDLLGVMKMLEARGVIRPPTHLGIMAKRARVHQYMEYAFKVGALSDDPNPNLNPNPDPNPSDSPFLDIVAASRESAALQPETKHTNLAAELAASVP